MLVNCYTAGTATRAVVPDEVGGGRTATDLLLAQGQRDLALRVLSNLAEMDLDNRHLLRVLGYRLMQADAPALAVPVFEQVLAMGQEEPQSFRDLGLALAFSIHRQGVEIGIVFWSCLLMLAAGTLVLLLAWRPRWALPCAAGVPLLGGVLALLR